MVKKVTISLIDSWIKGVSLEKNRFDDKPTRDSLIRYWRTLMTAIEIISKNTEKLTDIVFVKYENKLFDLIKEAYEFVTAYGKSLYDDRLYMHYIHDVFESIGWFEYEDLLAKEKKCGLDINSLISCQIFDYLTDIKLKDCVGKIGENIGEEDIVMSYCLFSETIKETLGTKAFGLCDSYLDKALNLFSDKLGARVFSYDYLRNSIIEEVLSRKKKLYEYVGKETNQFDKELLKYYSNDYRQAQEKLRDCYEILLQKFEQDNNSKEAIDVLETIIQIDEERLSTMKEPGNKLMLRDHYIQMINMLNSDSANKAIYQCKLDKLNKTITHDDEYVMDGDREYKRSAN